METTTNLERQQAHTLAEEYRSKGYEVIEDPAPEQLPDFLSGYQPDLLVRRGSEAIIVEVKSRSSLARDPQLRELARMLQTKPGWNLELVVVREEEKLNTPEGAHPFKREDILQRVEVAEQLLESGLHEAALLLAWSSAEAAVRLLTEEEGITLALLTPSYVLKQAVTNGVISRDDYNLLMHGMKYRNALAHGFKIVDFDPTLVRDVISTTKSLLQPKTSTTSV